MFMLISPSNVHNYFYNKKKHINRKNCVSFQELLFLLAEAKKFVIHGFYLFPSSKKTQSNFNHSNHQSTSLDHSVLILQVLPAGADK